MKYLTLAFVISILLAGCSQPTAPTTTVTPTQTTGATATPVATAAAGPEVGDEVAAPWNGSPYIAKITAIDGDKVSVEYLDGDKGEVMMSEVIELQVKEWKVGDSVLGNWSSGKLYPAKVTEKKDGDIYLLTWDDGSAPSEVEAKYILPR